MPLFFFAVGLILIIAGMRGNASAISSQLMSDAKGFLAFGTAILILGGLGAFPSVRPVSKALLVLVFIVFFLKNGQNVSTNIANDTLGLSGSMNAGAATGNSAANVASQGYQTGGLQTGSSGGSGDGKYLALIADM